MVVINHPVFAAFSVCAAKFYHLVHIVLLISHFISNFDKCYVIALVDLNYLASYNGCAAALVIISVPIVFSHMSLS